MPTTFACSDATGAPGISSCTDSHASPAPAGSLDTSTTGSHRFAVTASSSDGQSTTTTVNYNVTAVPHLAVKISLAGPAGAVGGSTFTEKIGVANAGPAAATNVITALDVPNGLTVTGAGGGTVSHSIVHFTAGTIPLSCWRRG